MQLLFLAAFNALFLELTMLKTLEIVLYPNLAYLIVSVTFLAFGISALIFSWFRRRIDATGINGFYFSSLPPALLALFIFIKTQNLSYSELLRAEAYSIFQWLIFLFLIIIPFLINGAVICWSFTMSSNPKRAYLIDLASAGLAALIFPIWLSVFGLDGCFFLLLTTPLLAWKLNTSSTSRIVSTAAIILFSVSYTLLNQSVFLPFVEKWFTPFRDQIHEKQIWTPTGSLNVVANKDYEAIKTIFFNGGQIGTLIFKFDGDYQALRKRSLLNPEKDYLRVGVLASHYLKTDTKAHVFQIGIGAGQEVKAALSFGAERIVGVELNHTVIDLLRHDYAEFSGNIFNHRNLELIYGDGRAAIERSTEQFDIIQLFSTYIESSFLQGRGALDTNFLITVDAFKTYFQHLRPGGIIHLNYANPYRVVRNAAMAWHDLGKADFRQHVVVISDFQYKDIIPTILFKNEPFTAAEIQRLTDLFSLSKKFKYVLEVSPFTPDRSKKWADIFSNDKSKLKHYIYDVSLTDDDRPFGNNFYNPWFVRSANALQELEESEKSTYEVLSQHLYSHANVLRWTPIATVLLLLLVVLLKIDDIANRPKITGVLLKIYFAGIGITYVGFQYFLLFQFSHFLDSPYLGATFIISLFMLSNSVGGLCLNSGWIKNSRFFVPAALVFVVVIMLLYRFEIMHYLFSEADPLLRTAAVSLVVFLIGFLLGFFFLAGMIKIQSYTLNQRMRFWALNSIACALAGPPILTLILLAGLKSSLTLLLTANVMLFIILLQSFSSKIDKTI